MPRSFADFLDSMMIALEADDITQQAQDDARSAMGGGSMRTDDNGPEEDITKTTDIFNQTPEDMVGDNENNEENPEDQDTTEDQPDENQETNEAPTDDPNLQETNQPRNEDDPSFARKNPIRDNLAQLYSIVSGDIELLTSSLNSMNDLPSIKVTNAVLRHLRNSKNYIYKTLTDDAADLDYEELLKRYITLKRVYDVCVKMLEIHFKDESRLQLGKSKHKK